MTGIIILLVLVLVICTVLMLKKKSTSNKNYSKQELTYITDYELIYDWDYCFMVAGVHAYSPKHIPQDGERVFIVDYKNPTYIGALGVFNYLGEMIGHVPNEKKHLINNEIIFFASHDNPTWITDDGKIGRLVICGTKIK